MIPRDTSESVVRFPIDIRALSSDTLVAIKSESLKVIAGLLGSRALQAAASRGFSSGDVQLVTEDYFSPIMEKLLILASHTPESIAFTCPSG